MEIERNVIMRKHKTEIKEYNSIKEYERKYYPKSFKKQTVELSDPSNLGTVLARESLSKFKQLISKQKICI